MEHSFCRWTRICSGALAASTTSHVTALHMRPPLGKQDCWPSVTWCAQNTPTWALNQYLTVAAFSQLGRPVVLVKVALQFTDTRVLAVRPLSVASAT